jgi:uncharacterized protein (DUF697 family)
MSYSIHSVAKEANTMHDIDRTQLETWETGYETDLYEFEADSTFEGPFNEVEEMDLASELLEITSEEELDQFLGSLFKKVGLGVGSFIKGPVGRSLGGMLKGVAKKVLPMAGGALGSFIPIPGVGTAVGTALGSAAANLFVMELEGLSQEDQEFEIARQFVKFAGEAANGLLRPATPPASAASGGVARGRSGRWIRRGRAIILLGA